MHNPCFMLSRGAPPAEDGLLFVLTGAQCETALVQRVAGTNIQRLSLVKQATSGQPIFIFDLDVRLLHGPFSADAPGSTYLEGRRGGPPSR